MASDDDDDDPSAWFLKNQKIIEAVIRFVCRRLGFWGDVAEDFAQDVRLRLIDPAAGVQRKFKGRSKLQTYLYVVVRRMGVDQITKREGKPRPSAPAEKGGPAAVRLEHLIKRKGLPLDEALAIVLREFPDADAAVLRELAAAFPVRPPPRPIGEEILDQLESGGPNPEQQLLAAEDLARRERISARLTELVSTLDEPDQLLMYLRFEQGMKVSDIARMLETDQKQLYRRIDAIKAHLRAVLESEGFHL